MINSVAYGGVSPPNPLHRSLVGAGSSRPLPASINSYRHAVSISLPMSQVKPR